MNAVRQLWLITSATVGVALRRLLHGPRVEGWPFGLEMLTDALRTKLGRLEDMAPARLRAQMMDSPVPRSVAARVRRDTGVIAEVPVEILTPDGWQPDRATVLYLHGGGYVVGSPGTHRDLTSRLAVASGARLVVADYRLAPEHPYPAAVEDAVAIWRGLGSGPLAVAGDSAGGGLSLAMMLRLREAGEALPVAAVLISPWVDLTLSEASLDTNTDDYLGRRAAETCAAHYLQGADPRGHEVSPVLADLRGFPPLLVFSGTIESLHDEHLRLVSVAAAAEVDVTLEEGERLVHAWPVFAGAVPEGRVAIETMATFLRAHLAGSPASETG